MTAYVPAVINIIAFFVGQVLVTRRHWAGFLVWAASNLVVLTVCLVDQDVPTAMMFIVYLTANLYSMFHWKQPVRRSRNQTRADVEQSLPSVG